MKGGGIIKRIAYSKTLADKWIKLGYKIVALSYTGCFGETSLAFHPVTVNLAPIQSVFLLYCIVVQLSTYF